MGDSLLAGWGELDLSLRFLSFEFWHLKWRKLVR